MIVNGAYSEINLLKEFLSLEMIYLFLETIAISVAGRSSTQPNGLIGNFTFEYSSLFGQFMSLGNDGNTQGVVFFH